MLIENPSNFRFLDPCGFLAIDGVNGAGKSTLIRAIIRRAKDFEAPLETTREPGGTELGLDLRRMVLESKDLAPLTELFLFAADRAHHVASHIRPALAGGRLVVTDRYYYSTTAFQGYGRRLPLDQVESINRLAINGCLPDVLILLDLDPKEGLKRTRMRIGSAGKDVFEEEELAFHVRLREGFLELARRCEEPCLVVDASKSESEVWTQVVPLVDNWIRAWKEHRLDERKSNRT